MAVDIDIKVESAKVLAGMREFARRTGQELRAVYRDQMRMSSNSLVRTFPVPTRYAGRQAILDDLNNVFVEAPSTFLLESWEAIGQPPARAFKAKGGGVLGVDEAHYNPSGDAAMMAMHHQRYRLKSTGRVTKAGAFTRDIGRWKFINRQIVPPGAIRRYARGVYKRVGMLKSGWMFPTGAGLVTKAPSWVRSARDAVGTRAAFVDRMTPSANGFLQLTNQVPYAKRQIGLVKIELRRRLSDLKRYAGKRLQREISRFNSGRAA